MRWPDGATCPDCEAKKVSYLKHPPYLEVREDCRKQFS